MPAFEKPNHSDEMTYSQNQLFHSLFNEHHLAFILKYDGFEGWNYSNSSYFFWAFKVSPFMELHPFDARLWIEALTSTWNQVFVLRLSTWASHCAELCLSICVFWHISHFVVFQPGTLMYFCRVCVNWNSKTKPAKDAQPIRNKAKKKKNCIYLSFRQKYSKTGGSR